MKTFFTSLIILSIVAFGLIWYYYSADYVVEKIPIGLIKDVQITGTKYTVWTLIKTENRAVIVRGASDVPIGKMAYFVNLKRRGWFVMFEGSSANYKY